MEFFGLKGLFFHHLKQLEKPLFFTVEMSEYDRNDYDFTVDFLVYSLPKLRHSHISLIPEFFVKDTGAPASTLKAHIAVDFRSEEDASDFLSKTSGQAIADARRFYEVIRSLIAR